MKIAYICYESQAKYGPEEAENNDLLLFLQQKGLDIHKEKWTDTNVDWQQYELAILKAPWDYHEKVVEFYKWLDELKRISVRLLNPYETIKWNSDKHYLKDIADAHLPVPQTVFLERGSEVKLVTCFNELKTDKLIIKPCISGGSRNTFAVTYKDIDHIEPKINKLVETESYIVQPFLNEIQSEGEWSFIFFNGQFSHCLLKKAKEGDFRVQQHFGGSVQIQTPSPHHLKTAELFISKFANGCLYARVDGTIVNDQFLLMELELIDPYLYLFAHHDSYESYYLALKQMIETIFILKTF